MDVDVHPRGQLTGKVALITGAASGMGAGTARRFIAEGAKVAVTDVAREAGERLVDELGPDALFIELDVADAAAWETAVSRVEERFGPINVLMNNAGIEAPGYVENFSEATWDRSLRINLHGVLLGMRSSYPSLRRSGGGSVINVSSLQGREADVGLVPYVAAKFGVRGITKAAAVEWGRDGIRVNAIFPGFTATALTTGIPDHLLGRIPLQVPGRPDRLGLPADIAALATFLASDRSSYVTGAEIVVDGGKSVRFPSSSHDYTSDLAAMKAGGDQ
jgi:3alpha(or 20beta)-hydroxysteroid dehydrogenase